MHQHPTRAPPGEGKLPRARRHPHRHNHNSNGNQHKRKPRYNHKDNNRLYFLNLVEEVGLQHNTTSYD